MSTDTRFNKILNNLDKVIDRNGGYGSDVDFSPRTKHHEEMIEDSMAEFIVKQANEWLDEDRLLKIEGNRLRLGVSNAELSLIEQEQMLKKETKNEL